MKNLKTLMLMIALNFGVIGSSFSLDTLETNPGTVNEMIQISTNVGSALETRDFVTARKLIEKLLPLMKKEIKRSKKLLAKNRKEQQDLGMIKKQEKELLRKYELYMKLEHYVKVSPAALRAKSEDITLILDEIRVIMKR